MKWRMNARKELEVLLSQPGLQTPLAAVVVFRDRKRAVSVVARLHKGSTPEELKEFLKQLDFDYDAGHGTQYLFGTVWFGQGVWAERVEYDGAENWYVRRMPDIPEYLIKED